MSGQLIELVIIGILVVVIGFLVYLLFQNRKVEIDGHIVILEKDGGGTLYSLELMVDPDEIENKKLLTFKVRK